MFIWRSNLLGSSGKGHEYMLKYLLGTNNGVMNDDNAVTGGHYPRRGNRFRAGRRYEGKLDLVTTLDFRMSSTCVYSDIVLPTATWYEKDDLNTSDMHPFIHPSVEGHRSRVGSALRLGYLQRVGQEVL